MKTRVLALLLSLFFHYTFPSATAQVPLKQWDRTFGGTGYDYCYTAQPTSDGGYILGGESTSGRSGDKTQAGAGDWDYWVVKVDATGTKQWDRTFGGSAWDYLPAVQQTTDGGYILGGSSISGISGDKTQPNLGAHDYWIIKLDANGVKQWDRTFGGNNSDMVSAIQQTSDGGYLVGGYSQSGVSGDKSQANLGAYDYWVVKITATGVKQWDRTFGGPGIDFLTCLQQTSDGGYLLGGESRTDPNPEITAANSLLFNMWVIKLDANGTRQWDRTFGGSGYDGVARVQQTADGGYLVGGSSTSGISADKTQPSQGSTDYWVLKLTASGVKQWDKTLGGSGGDGLTALQQTADGGYLLGGTSQSGLGGDKTQTSQGNNDFWLVKLDGNGTTQWDQALGGSGSDVLCSLQPTGDGGYILGGHSDSGSGGDKSQASQGQNDYWLVKLGAGPLATVAATKPAPLTAFPNPATTHVTVQGQAGTPYQLLSPVGHVVHTGQVGDPPLNLHALPAGLYLLRDPTTGRLSKLVKQ